MPSGKSSALFGVISLMVTIIGTFISLPFLYDFSVSVDSMRVDIDPDNTAHIYFEVHPGWLYNKDISLRAESVPSSIHLNFEPQILEHGSNSVSMVTISAEKDAPPGEYLISLIGDGSDGKEHTCKLTLNVNSNNKGDNGSISINTHEFNPEPGSKSGSISVSSSPGGASIYLDEVYQGETPEILDNIEQGSHIITLKLEEYRDWTQTVSVSADKMTPVSPILEFNPTSGSISVSSSPSGASIYLDEVYQGETPEILDNIEQGSHIITLKLEEYEDWTQTVSVSADKTTPVSPTLELNPISTPSAEIENIWVEHNVPIGSLNGMAIHVNFNTLNLKDEKCSCIAYFYSESGEPLRDFNQEYYTYDGTVCAGADFTPTYVDAVNDIIILIPNNELHMSQGTFNLEFNVVIWHENTELTMSEMVPFVYTSNSYY